ncbi:MAG TPA: DUF1573 domain-containing protein [Planctomycetota bacterium]
MIRILPILLALAWLPGCEDDPKSAPGASASVMDGYDTADPEASFARLLAEDSKSNLDLAHDEVELGDVLQQTQREVPFPFVVNGPDEVVITRLTPSCGCTGVEIRVAGETWPEGKPLPAGTKGELVATFDSQNFLHGKVSTIDVQGNAANMPLKLTIRANIRPLFDPSPATVRFGEVHQSELLAEGFRTRSVTVVGAESFALTGWARLPKGITIKDTNAPESEPGGLAQSRTFEVTIGSEIGTGTLYETAVAETSLGKMLEFTIQAEVLGRVRYFPQKRISFGLLTPGQAPTRSLRVVGTEAGTPVPEPTLAMAGDEHEAFLWTVQTKDGGQEHQVRIRIRPDAPIGRHAGTLTVSYPPETGLESEEFIVSAIVRQPQ